MESVSPGLAHRLEDIPGVESVTVDLTDEGGGINIRLRPGVSETEVLERLRTVLIAYGVRSSKPEPIAEPVPEQEGQDDTSVLGVHVRITPLDHGARVEVETKSVKSFRVVAANPEAIAQGLSDAWCQVIGRVPVEVVQVRLSDSGELAVTAFDGDSERTGRADVGAGWETALTLAVGRALGVVADSIFAGSP